MVAWLLCLCSILSLFSTFGSTAAEAAAPESAQDTAISESAPASEEPAYSVTSIGEMALDEPSATAARAAFPISIEYTYMHSPERPSAWAPVYSIPGTL